MSSSRSRSCHPVAQHFASSCARGRRQSPRVYRSTIERLQSASFVRCGLLLRNASRVDRVVAPAVADVAAAFGDESAAASRRDRDPACGSPYESPAALLRTRRKTCHESANHPIRFPFWDELQPRCCSHCLRGLRDYLPREIVTFRVVVGIRWLATGVSGLDLIVPEACSRKRCGSPTSRHSGRPVSIDALVQAAEVFRRRSPFRQRCIVLSRDRRAWFSITRRLNPPRPINAHRSSRPCRGDMNLVERRRLSLDEP